jgi:hypothetical protein
MNDPVNQRAVMMLKFSETGFEWSHRLFGTGLEKHVHTSSNQIPHVTLERVLCPVFAVASIAP